MTNLATPLQNMARRLAVERSAHDGGADVTALQAVKATGGLGHHGGSGRWVCLKTGNIKTNHPIFWVPALQTNPDGCSMCCS